MKGWNPFHVDFFSVHLSFSSEVTDLHTSCVELWLKSQFDTDIKLLSSGQGSDDGWSSCNFHVQDSKLSESNVLCRHTVAISRLYAYNQLLLLRGRILLVSFWSLVILTELFNIIRYTWFCLCHCFSAFIFPARHDSACLNHFLLSQSLLFGVRYCVPQMPV